MVSVIKCGTLFNGVDASLLHDVTVLVEKGVIKAIGPTESLPHPPNADVLDYSRYFVMPGLCDYHTHLGYGNAKSEEDIDLYACVEFRALRGLFMAQRTLNAGVTSLCNPGGPSRVGIAIRDAINCGMYEGPRITTTGPYITSRQGLTDWYPTWIGQPETSIGHLVRSQSEAIEEIREQVKDGVDAIKIAMDGIQSRRSAAKNDGLIAAFDQHETKKMVDEIHRLGRRVIVHARGREAVLYSAKAGVDVIFHASWIDDEGIEAAVKSGSAICPTLTLLVNNYEFAQPSDPTSKFGAAACKREAETAFENLRKARKAGIPILVGSETGFAMTPYGEWHAKELDILVRYLGFSPVEALIAATSATGAYVIDGGASGSLAVGKNADFLVVDGDPSTDVTHLLDQTRVKAVLKGGNLVSSLDREVDSSLISDFSMRAWNDIYTKRRVTELGLSLVGRMAKAVRDS